MPLRWRRHSKMPLSSADDAARATGRTGPSGAARRAPATTSTWSCRFAPTPGRSWRDRDAVRAQVLAPGRCPRASGSAATAARRPTAAPRAARTKRCGAPPTRASTPIARRPSKQRSRVVCAPVTTVRLGAAEVGREVGLGGAEALAVLVRHLVQADAFLARAVEVGGCTGSRPARPASTKTGAEAMRAAQVHHVERAAAAVAGVGAALVVLGALEVGQHVGPAPAGVAFGGPVVVVVAAGRARRSWR